MEKEYWTILIWKVNQEHHVETKKAVHSWSSRTKAAGYSLWRWCLSNLDAMSVMRAFGFPDQAVDCWC